MIRDWEAILVGEAWANTGNAKCDRTTFSKANFPWNEHNNLGKGNKMLLWYVLEFLYGAWF